MTREFQDRHVVVTGGAGALGSAVVGALLERGAVCHLPVHRRRPPGAERERLHLGECDLTDEGSVASYFAELPALWASIHAAGGFSMAPVTETPLAEFERMIRMNTVTCFLASREAIRRMRAGGGGGRIVNVAARPAVVAAGGMVAYSAAKAAVAHMTRALAEEVRGDGILVNAVLPSVIDTPENRRAMPGADHDAWPRPQEIAEVLCFLASPASAVTSGALVPVYGRG